MDIFKETDKFANSNIPKNTIRTNTLNVGEKKKRLSNMTC